MIHALGALLLVASPTARADEATASDGGLRARIEQILEAADQSSAARGRMIVDLGPGAVAPVLEVLAARESFWCSAAIGPAEQALLYALELNSRWDLDQALAACAAADVALESRGAALAILGELGTQGELALVFEIAAPGPAGEIDALLGPPFGRALAGMARREAAPWTLLKARVGELQGQARRHAVAELMEADPPLLGELIVEVLGDDPGFDAWLLPRAVRWADGRPSIPDELQAAVRRALAARDPRLRREAALAAGRLGDWKALPLLLAAVEEQDPALRAAGGQALCQLTGLALRPDPEAWCAWLAREEQWWLEHGDACLALLDGTPAEISAGLAEVAKHRLHRDELARAVAPLTADPDPGVVSQAAATLGELGGPLAVRALVPLVEHPVAAVCAVARAALKRAGASAPSAATGSRAGAAAGGKTVPSPAG